VFDIGYSDVTPELEAANIPFNAGDAAPGGGGFWGGLKSGASAVGDFAKTATDVGSEVLSPIGKFAKAALPVAQIGSAVGGFMASRDAAGAAKEQARNQRRAQETQLGSSQPLAAYGSDVLSRSQAGKLDPATEAQINQWLQAEIQRIQQDFARRGQGDSSGVADAINNAKLKALAMRSQAVTSQASGGVAALSGAAGAAGGVNQSAGQNQQSIEQLIAEANKMLASTTASAG